MGPDSLDDVPEILPGIEAHGSAALPQTRDGGRGLASLWAPGEEPVLASQCKWPNGVLGGVVVSLQTAVFEISAQCFLLIRGVGHGRGAPASRASRPMQVLFPTDVRSGRSEGKAQGLNSSRALCSHEGGCSKTRGTVQEVTRAWGRILKV